MAKFDIKTVKPKFVVTTSPENKIDVVVNKPIIETKLSKSFFKLKNTGGPAGPRGEQGERGEQGLPGEPGPQGEPGRDGESATIEVASTTTLPAGSSATVENVGTSSQASLAFGIPKGDKGDTGAAGADGYSPSASVTQTSTGATISITDKTGTTTANITNGTDGQDGAPGADGYSPSATVTQTSSGATISITDKDGITTANVSNGTDGTDGTDGFSPIATVTPTATGATVSITDAQGTTTADITNGTDGTDGQDGQAATITVGTVTTLQPNQSAYVTNVGTSSAAIFDIGIPQGQKGEAGSGTGDMLASTYDPNGTVAAAGGIPDYVDSSVPTKTSDLTNDGENGTSTYVEATALTDGSVTKVGTSTVGATDRPIYLANGTPTQVNQPTSGSWFQGTPRVTPDGVMEMGKYIDFHNASDETKDYSVRLYTDNTGSSSVLLPNSNGRIALESQIPDSTSDLTNDSGFITSSDLPTKTSDLTNDGSDGTSTYVEADELATVATSGAYNDLTGTPTIPTVNDATLIIKQNSTTVGTFTANASSDKIVALTDTTYSDFVGATGSTPGSAGLVPAPTTADVDKVLKGDGTWGTVAAGAFIGYVSGDLTMMIGTRFSVNVDTTYLVSIDYVAFKDALTAGSKVIFRDSAGNDMVVTGYASAADTYYVIIGANRSTGLLSYDVSQGWLYYNVAVPQNFSELSGAIVTSQIASKAVTSSKIDWTTIQDEITAAQIAVRSVGVLEPVLTSAISDGGTATIAMAGEFPDTYIYLNTHINVREIVMLTRMGTTLREDPIYRSSSITSSFSLSSSAALTITGAGNCRGMLYLLRQAKRPA